MEPKAIVSAASELAGPAFFRLSAGADLLRVGGRIALFSPGGERLYELNETAALLASMLKEGATLGTLATALEEGGFDGATARRLTIDLLKQWSRQGVIEGAAPVESPPPHGSQPIHIAGVTATIRYPTDELRALVSPTFAHLVTGAGQAALADIELVQGDEMVFLSTGGTSYAAIDAGEATPAIKAYLVEQVLAKAPPRIALHTACLARGNGALLLSGPPGAGKSTLTVALSHSGFDYASDDITLLGSEGLVEGVPFAPGLKRGAWPLLRSFRPDLEDLPIHLRLDGIEVRYLTVPQAPPAGEMRAKWIVHLSRAPDARAQLRELDPLDALTRLASEAYSAAGAATLREMRALVALVEQARCYELVYSDLADAVGVLKAACADD